MGLVPPRAGFLELLRERADASGALLILDEVISRLSRRARRRAGAARACGGDLTILGKVLGGGLPAAAVGGRGELMRMLAPAGEVYQAGTLSGNPLAVAAGLATLAPARRVAYLRLAAITDQLAAGLREAARGERPVQVASVPGLLTVFFSERPVLASTTRRPATWRPTPRGAASCSRAGSIRRRRSSRRGSPRSRTPPSRSSARSPPPRRRSRSSVSAPVRAGDAALERLRRCCSTRAV